MRYPAITLPGISDFENARNVSPQDAYTPLIARIILETLQVHQNMRFIHGTFTERSEHGRITAQSEILSRHVIAKSIFDS